MDSATLVNEQIDYGQRLTDLLVKHQFSFSAAFLTRTADQDNWRLYVITDLVDTQGLTKAYRDLFDRINGQLPIEFRNPSITLIGPSDPLARDILAFQKEFPGSGGRGGRSRNLAAAGLEEFYLYDFPTLVTSPMTPNQVLSLALTSMQQPGLKAPMTIALRDGTTFHGLPFGFEIANGQPTIKFIDDADKTPKIYSPDQILSMQ